MAPNQPRGDTGDPGGPGRAASRTRGPKGSRRQSTQPIATQPMATQPMAWLALLGMLFHVAFAFGHIDGPAHTDGVLVAGIERLAGHREEPAPEHRDARPHGHCDICIVTSMGAALPADAADHGVGALAFHTIDWSRIAARPHMPDPASHHEIRGPPGA